MSSSKSDNVFGSNGRRVQTGKEQLYAEQEQPVPQQSRLGAGAGALSSSRSTQRLTGGTNQLKPVTSPT